MDEPIKRWYFDNYPDRREGNDRSWVELSENNDEASFGGRRVQVYLKGKEVLTFDGELDQWGTWIGITMSSETIDKDRDKWPRPGFTVAQEWSTKSFVQALMAALTEFAKICDLEGKTEKQIPEYEEIPSPVV